MPCTIVSHTGKRDNIGVSAWAQVARAKNQKNKKKSKNTNTKTDAEKELKNIMFEAGNKKNEQKITKTRREMDRQVQEFRRSCLEGEIQQALFEFDRKEEKDLRTIELFISQVEQNKDMLALLRASKTAKDYRFWTDLMENYDFQTYLDIEHFSDKGWYTLCPSCDWCVYPNMEEHHCNCCTVLVKDRIYYSS